MPLSARSLIELSKLLDPGQNARRDKLSVLTDAIREVTRLRTEAVSLQRLNKILEVPLLPLVISMVCRWYKQSRMLYSEAVTLLCCYSAGALVVLLDSSCRYYEFESML